jgi:hypothetical protein
MTEAGRRKVFLVREAFEWTYGDQPPAVKSPAVWAFATLEEAIACRDQLKRTCRHVNPFGWSGRRLAELTSMKERAFRARISQLKLPAPKDKLWANWWWRITQQRGSAIRPDQLAALWGTLDRAEPYRIEERDLELPSAGPPKTVYVVQRLTWQYNDNWYDLGNDEPLRAFRDRGRAEAYRWELEQAARNEAHSPCRVGGPLGRCTTLSQEELLQQLRRFGVGAPTGAVPSEYDHPIFHNRAWWDDLRENAATLFHRVWDLFNLVRFFDVLEVETDGEQEGEPA